jgi:SAM-dependent MidA family methyltransferase
MELALYCPVYGFYETEGDKIGRAGDFYTSVSVGSLFGELLAFQFSDWLSEIRAAKKYLTNALFIVEAGAYRGQLARDILSWIQSFHPEIFESLEYWIVEPSAVLRKKQERTLADFAGKVHWCLRLSDLAEHSGGEGIIFSNELLDAMPVRRIGWCVNERRWFEWGVAMQNERLVWTRIFDPENAFPAPQLPSEVLAILPDDYTIEIGSAANQWWREAATLLKNGKLLAIDYGGTAEELISPERTGGTLRTYSKHRVGDDLLSRPGEQDITAHVNFTAIQNTGELAGLQTEGLFTQEKFLVRIAEKTWKQSEQFSDWNAARRRQLQTLIHPEHLGRPFRVLLQSRQSEGASNS